MTKETMTIHKALSELKVLDSRIEDSIYDSKFCTVNKHINQKIDGVCIEDYKKLVVGKYDKVTDLINRRNAIKRAVVLSNATTKVIVNDREYTIAEAIEMKNHGIELQELLLAKMKDNYGNAKANLERQNGSELEKRAENHIQGLYGTKDVKVASEEITAAKNAFIKSQTYDLIDPINIADKIEKLEEKISSFKSEIDSILSTSNAITTIEVEY